MTRDVVDVTERRRRVSIFDVRLIYEIINLCETTIITNWWGVYQRNVIEAKEDASTFDIKLKYS